MSRTARATTTAIFGYVRFAFSIATGLWLVPFTLSHVGSRLYGFWLASGELLAYAALTEFGVLVTVPWMVAEADGAGDRDRLRSIVTTGVAAALVSAAGYVVVVSVLIFALPFIVHLGPAERSAVLGPVLIVAAAAIFVLPLRVFYSVLMGLQDVRFNGIMDLFWLVVTVGTTAGLLKAGFGLYAIALGTALPQLFTGLVNLMRVGAIAPDLLRHWRRPPWADVRKLFKEGAGAWVGGWGWRLISATDGLVLAALGQPAAVTALACTAKLSAALVQLSWVPCDSGLIGLANLAGERQDTKLRETIVVMVRVYLALAGAAACIVLAVNPAFVSRWVGGQLFAGGKANALLAMVAIAMTFAHALAVIASVLGQRMQIGVATLGSGVAHVLAAIVLGRWLGIPGVILAGIVSHGLVFPLLAWRPFAVAARMPETALIGDVVRPWLLRFLPLVAVSIAIEQVMGVPTVPVTIALGAAVGFAAMWHMRPLYLSFGPVRALYDRFFKWLPPRAARGAGTA
jgi:O-antigen/teichoic acid export membrane protein